MRFIFPYIFIALSISLFVFFARPLYKEVIVLRASSVAYDTALTHSTDLQKVRDTLVSKYANINDQDKNRLAHFLPNTVDNIQLILEIEKIASMNGMVVSNILFAPPQSINDKSSASKSDTMKSYGTFNLEFKTQARYEVFSIFLQDLEKNLRLIDVKSISFAINNNSRTASPDPLTYEYLVKIQTYWLK